MSSSPVQPAYFARLQSADSERVRRQKEVLEGVMAALSASKEGKDHPRLLTPERREALYIGRLEFKWNDAISRRPLLPVIYVTQPLEDWRDFTNTIRGRFGATRQE